MRWASAVSDAEDLDAAVRDASAAIRSQLAGSAPHLAIAFVSEHHRDGFERVPQLLNAALGSTWLLGCSAGGVIGGGKEIEGRAGLSVTAAVLPNVGVHPFHLDASALPAFDDAAGWGQRLGIPAGTDPHLILLPDPFTFDVETLIRGLDQIYPTSAKLGGLASGGRQPGANALFLDSRTHRSGLVGVALTGDVEVDTIVAQGCRPIGQPMFVTKCQRNLLYELDGQPALQVLQELFESLDPSDQELARHSLFLGIVMTEKRQEYRHGDFLIRNLLGLDQDRSALVIGALLHENSVVQFHLRDAKTSADDLSQVLIRYQAEHEKVAPSGALLFSCLGRGMHLYGRPDHDTDALRQHIGAIPLGGFFCNGEIGPVHGTTFLHGYTSSFGLFRPRR